MFKNWETVKRIKNTQYEIGGDVIKAKNEIDKTFALSNKGNVIDSEVQDYYEKQMDILKGAKAKAYNELANIDEEIRKRK